MSIPQHPPPHSAPPSASHADPYATLGLDHDATPSKIKVAYRKLALRYHPDRQQSPIPTGEGTHQSSSSDSQHDVERRHEAEEELSSMQATDKFAQIASAYSILSDPTKKREYDHLYKYGAFDNHQSRGGRTKDRDSRNPSPSGHSHQHNTTSTNNNYRYTEDYSGGYYKPGYVPPKHSTNTTAAQAFQQRAAAASAAAAAFQGMQSQDSFFDDLIYSPRSRGHGGGGENDNTTSCNNQGDSDQPPSSTDENNSGNTRKQQPGIGFSFAPVGKHLSIHVPSRNEIMANMAAQQMSNMTGNNDGGETTRPRSNSASHLFGTRVTFSQNSTVQSGLNPLTACVGTSACTGNSDTTTTTDSNNTPLKEKKVVSTTTRIAHGQRRIVKRTAHLKADGTKEVVIEENGVVKRRYVEENPNVNNDCNANNTTSKTAREADGKDAQNNYRGADEKEGGDQGKSGGLQREKKFTLLGLFKSCLEPCAPIAG